MSARQTSSRDVGTRIWWLTALVHGEAMFKHPWRYTKAAYWRLLRKRLRSRSQFAPLLGRSRHIYNLWMAKHERRSWSEFRMSAPEGGNEPIFIVLDTRAEPLEAARTLAWVNHLGNSNLFLLVTGNGRLPQWSENSSNVQAFADTAQLRTFLGGRLPCWICPIGPGDRMPEGALDAYRLAIAGIDGLGIAYADCDEFNADSRRTNPHFKPRWNAELFRGHDYLSYSSVIRLPDEAALALIEEAENWVEGLVSQIASNRAATIHHVPLVLHHRRPGNGSKEQILASARRLDGPADALPSCTVIIPTHNQGDLLETCVNSLMATEYPGLELLVIDHDSNDPRTIAYLDQLRGKGIRIMPFSGPFNFSAMNNRAVEQVDSDLLCFLNNDVEALDANWLTTMAQRAIRPEIGAVGAKLLYPDRSIQHAGVVLGINGGAGHAHRFQPDDSLGYFGRAHLPQFVSAVTAACMVTQRAKFLAIDGFDEVALPVAFNDVDLCMKLNAKGWQSFYEPRAVLLHHESKSRGKDHAPEKRRRFAGEFSTLQQRWETDILVDPYHHPELSRHSEQFVLRA